MMTATRRKAMVATLAVLAGLFVFTDARAYASLSGFSLASQFKYGQQGEGIAVDESTDDVYVFDSNGSIAKFDADGSPVNFSALASNQITNTGAYGFGETELAVDNSAGPAKGDIYLAGGAGVKIYAPDGTKIGELTEVSGRPWGEVACGVAVDRSGNIYVGLYPDNIDKYTPYGNPATNNDYVGSHGGFNQICELAAGPEGALYAATWTPTRRGPVAKLDSFQANGTEQIAAQAAGTLSVANSPSAELFISQSVEPSLSQPGLIKQYDPAGNLLSTFGVETEQYNTLAINAKNGRLYAYQGGNAGTIEIWQGFVTPEVRTAQATSLDASGNATLNGTVNPEGVSVGSCSFQYGPNASYGSVAPCAQSLPLTGGSVVPVSADLSGLTLNHVYHYRLSTADEHGTINGADETLAILVRPTAKSQPTASEIERSAARLTGAVNPEQGVTRYYFEYGPTEDYGDKTSAMDTGDEVAGDVEFSEKIENLLPETTYHYRVVASNIAGTTFGADHMFTTGAATPPSAVTGGATNVAQNTAIITGTVDTNGLPTSYGFEIGTSTDYGPPTGLGAAGAGFAKAAASLFLAGLQPGTTYHYRLAATNVDGTAYGADRTFMTGVFASTFAEPPAPLPFVQVPSIVFPSEAKPVVVKKKATKPKKGKKHSPVKSKKRTKSKKKK